MIPSSEAQILLKSGEEVFPYEFDESEFRCWEGELIAIILFNNPAADRNTIHSVDAYICSVAHATKRKAGITRKRIRSINDELIIRFSTASRVPLFKESPAQNANKQNSTGTRILQKSISSLQSALGNTTINLVHHISAVGVSTSIQNKIEESVRCKIHMTAYCVIGDSSTKSSDAQFQGCILSLSTPTEKDDASQVRTLEPKERLGPNCYNLCSYTPTPLLSISLEEAIQNDQRSQNKRNQSETHSSQALLQQCLKRLLIGRLIVCPVVSNNPSANIWEQEHQKQTCMQDAPTATIQTTLQSTVVSLKVPTLNSNLSKTHTYKVHNVLPHYKAAPVGGGIGILHGAPAGATNIGKRSRHEASRSNLFIILPSTRITLTCKKPTVGHNNSIDGDPHRECRRSDDDSIIKKKCDRHATANDNKAIRAPSTTAENPLEVPHTGAPNKLILDSIQAVQSLSLYLSPKHDMPPQDQIPHYSSGIIADIPRAFLLSGPPGVGKTFAIRTAVQATNSLDDSTDDSTRLVSIRGSEILSAGANEAEAALELRRHFMTAVDFASKRAKNTSVLFMDECDALLSSHIAGATLGDLLDQMTTPFHKKHSRSRYDDGNNVHNRHNIDYGGWRRVLVVAATNRIDAIPSYLRRPGRFDRELCISPPNKELRYEILSSILNEMDGSSPTKTSSSLPIMIDVKDIEEIAGLCVGYVAADLSSLVRRAAFLTVKDGKTSITFQSLKDAMKDVRASALRDSAINAPPTTRWDDIAGDAGGAKTALRRAVEWPQTKKRDFQRLGLDPPRGILLHGPPGCAKTTLARAAAGASGVAFLSLSPADVYASSYVGEAEAVVRRAFSLARSAAPCILFFDEIDSIVSTSGQNSSGMDRGTNAEARVLSTFLNEMDGVDGSISDGVLVLGATNRPSALDSALLRPGRFDRVIYVPPPDEQGRRQILDAQCRSWNSDSSKENDFANMQGGGNIDISYLCRDDVSGMMTGAEIVGACREAGMRAIREVLKTGKSVSIDHTPAVLQGHLEAALKGVKPLLSDPAVLHEYTSFEEEHTK